MLQVSKHASTPLRKIVLACTLVLGVGAGLAANDAIEYFTLERGVPVVVSSAVFAEDSAPRGGTANLIVTRLKTRGCPLERHTFWVSRKTGEIVPGEIKAGGKIGPGEKVRTIPPITINIPENLRPGEQWGLDPLLYYHCPDKTYIVTQPVAWIAVTE